MSDPTPPATGRDEHGDSRVNAADGQLPVADADTPKAHEGAGEHGSSQDGIVKDQTEPIVHGDHAVEGKEVVVEDLNHNASLENPVPAHSAALLSSAIPLEITIPDPSTIESRHAPDSPTTSLITSLRSQLTLLSDQSQALNAKLIEAISRHADLEDVHINLQQKHTELEGKAKDLEGEKLRWEESMNTGLLVERSQIREEMQRLATGLVEEERRRGSAEERRQKVESEVDDLAASLFDQANTMVAAERMARTQAESRLKETEENLAAAESAVRDMQLHLQSLSAPGGVSSPPRTVSTSIPRRYLASHLPYSEFLTFLQHLRALRPLREASKAMFPPPAIITLLAQPFIARAIVEDHDPTIRLDSAPDLSYFSRRNVGPAIIAGELIIEPVSANTLLGSTTALPHEIGCSLCGKPVFPSTVPQSPATSQFGPPPNHPTQRSSRFSLKPFFNATSASPSGGISTNAGGSASPSQSPLASPSPAVSSIVLSSVYIFRVARPATATAGSNEKETKLYPLCKTGWCLERLRAACELWHFVRTGIIHVVWHGDDGYALMTEKEAIEARRVSASSQSATTASVTPHAHAAAEKPPLPERKKSGGWGLGFKLGGGERKSEGSGAGGTASGWFGRSGSATPPLVSPSAETSDQKRSLGLDAELGEGPADSEERRETLAAPIQLEEKSPAEPEENLREGEEAQDGKRDVPRIEEHEASPAAPLKSAEGEEGAEEEKDDHKDEHPGRGLKPTRNDSSHSLTTSNAGTEEGTFSTPKEQQSELVDDPHAVGSPVEESKDINQEQEAKEVGENGLDVVDLTSPLPPHEAESVAAEAQPEPSSATDTKPPPIPRRAAARMSVQVPKDSASISEVGQASPLPTSTEESQDEETDTKLEESISREPTPTVDLSDTHPHTNSTTKARHPPPPPLPPRHPRTPTNQIAEGANTVLDGEKRWMKVPTNGAKGDKGDQFSESWEEKTWKTVVRLKEGMWKARVGVSDSLDD